jgi:hypothetical protein
VRIVRRDGGSVVTWRRAQMLLLSAQGMGVAAIAKVALTSEDRVRDVIRNFNADAFSSLYPRYRGGRPPKFTLAQRREIKKIPRSRPAMTCRSPPGGCPSWPSSWSLGRWSTTSATRACGSCSARRASPFNAGKPGKPAPTRIMRRKPGRAPVCHRRPRGDPRAGRAGDHRYRAISLPVQRQANDAWLPPVGPGPCAGPCQEWLKDAERGTEQGINVVGDKPTEPSGQFVQVQGPPTR